jgi:hypothetical protein
LAALIQSYASMLPQERGLHYARSGLTQLADSPARSTQQDCASLVFEN